MTPEYLRKQLVIWQRLLWVCLGAGVTLLATALGDAGRYGGMSRGWFGVWLLLVLGTLPAGLALLTARDWRALPLDERLDTAFGFLAVAWMMLLALFIRAVFDWPGGPGWLIILVLGVGALLAAEYWRLRQRERGDAETMFP
jgi:hypothetical protein